MLRLQGVDAGYGATRILRNVTLSVPDGTVVGVLGPNGAGKTTLLRVASGLLAPTAGRVSIDGTEVPASPHTLVDHGVCHVPEGRGIFGALTVRENMRLACRDGDPDTAYDRAVSAFPKLGDRMAQQAGTMSGGEQQMLALARAYIQRPRYVLLDEVSMGLAPKIVEEIFEFLARLGSEGAGLLLVEQYVGKVLAIADVVYMVGRGRIGFAGEPGEFAERDVFGSYLGAAAT